MIARHRIPNLLTGSRLVLSGLQFVIVCLYIQARASGGGRSGAIVWREGALGEAFGAWSGALLGLAFGLFVVAVLTDWADGYLARKWKVVSAFGRIADPFADKIVISGSFALMLPLGEAVVPVAPWMVIVIIAREYLVTSIRGYAEAKGIAFSASIWGKAKMILQSFCVGALLLALACGEGWPDWGWSALVGVVWLAVVATVGSGLVYIHQARSLLKGVAGDVESGATTAASATADER